jgi:diketogulonate reductase-like aldo/keto reductase
MKIPTKTLKSGFSLPVYGLGTWQMGGRFEADDSKDEEEIAAIKAAIDRGIKHIDTAEVYGAGHCEELVGEAIKDYDRQELIIATKVASHNETYDGILKSCEGSLKRLGIDYIDLYLLHRFPGPGMPIDKAMKALDRLVDEKIVKNIGACNLTSNRLEAAQSLTSNQLVCNQVHYSLECRESVERGVLRYCQDNDILVSAWGPLSKGSLQNALVLKEMAEKYGKTPYQVAINWLISQPNVITIPKTTHVEHLEENLGSLGWSLTKEDMDKLAKDFPGQITVSDRVPLDYIADIEA